MVVVTVCESFNAKLSAFVAGRDIRNTAVSCSLTNKSLCPPAEQELHDSLGIGSHRAQISITGGVDDLNEFLQRINNENAHVHSRV